MSNHLSKSLFSIPRLKKSRSRQQNQPENSTSLYLNALTADDAFLRFAAVPDKTFFSPRNPERNSIIFLCIPSLPRPFSPLTARTEFYFQHCISSARTPFFLPAQPRTEFYSLTLHASSLRRGPRLPRCITIFSVLSAAFHHAGHRVSQHAEYIQRSCPKCVAQHRNGEIFPPANATAATNRGAGTAIQDEYKKKPYPSARREAGDYRQEEMAAGDIL